MENIGLITPDFTEAAEEVGAGIYKVRITASEKGEWPAKEDRKAIHWIKWTLETFGETETKNNGRRIYHRTNVSGKVMRPFEQFYQAAMGETFPRGKGFDPTMLYGREVEVTLKPGKNKDGSETGFMEVGSVKPIAKH